MAYGKHLGKHTSICKRGMKGLVKVPGENTVHNYVACLNIFSSFKERIFPFQAEKFLLKNDNG